MSYRDEQIQRNENALDEMITKAPYSPQDREIDGMRFRVYYRRSNAKEKSAATRFQRMPVGRVRVIMVNGRRVSKKEAYLIAQLVVSPASAAQMNKAARNGNGII